MFDLLGPIPDPRTRWLHFVGLLNGLALQPLEIRTSKKPNRQSEPNGAGSVSCRRELNGDEASVADG
jgi:hypothetical protein